MSLNAMPVGTKVSHMYRKIAYTASVLLSLPAFAAMSGEQGPADPAVRVAITRAIPLLEKGSAGSAEKRTCFTCHNQGIAVFALVEAKRRGFEVQDENLRQQVSHTVAHLKRGRKNYIAGKGQGGKVLTAGYALWTLEAGGHAPDELTKSVAGFLLTYQRERGYWTHRGRRPPSSGSDFTATYVALRGLATYGTEKQVEQIAERKKAVLEWLIDTTPRDTEDRVFRLRSLQYAGADEQAIHQAVQELIGQQREDGGWAQTAEMDSDAYATATTIVALLRDGGLNAEHPKLQRGIRFLLETQQDDGSWHVVTRAKGFQKYFESGFPHGKDQFISMAASGWATVALTLALPESR